LALLTERFSLQSLVSIIHVAKHFRHIVKYDLVSSVKTTQLPAVFSKVTDIQSSIDTGKLAIYNWTLLLSITPPHHLSIFYANSRADAYGPTPYA